MKGDFAQIQGYASAFASSVITSNISWRALWGWKQPELQNSAKAYCLKTSLLCSEWDYNNCSKVWLHHSINSHL